MLDNETPGQKAKCNVKLCLLMIPTQRERLVDIGKPECFSTIREYDHSQTFIYVLTRLYNIAQLTILFFVF